MDDRARPLLEDDLDADPLRQFDVWYREGAQVVRAPEAMALATASAGGLPSLRMVLLKDFGEPGFVFFTGYDSRKGRDLRENPRAALMLYWDALGRQARIEGAVEQTSAEESERYFHSRPRGAQIAALASRQSSVLESRDELEARFAALEEELEGKEVPLPSAWGGFRLVPDQFEFWQHRENRLHDRLLYRRVDEGWAVERLAP